MSGEDDFSQRQMFGATISRLLAPVRQYLEGPTAEWVSEVIINGPNEIFVESKGRLSRIDATFNDAEALAAAARAIAQFSGKLMTADALSIEARLPDGSRVHIVQPPAARNGLSIAIRRFQKANRALDDLVAAGALTAEVVEFLAACLALHKNVVISGGTSTGKTTILNALSELIEEDERVIAIEDVNELQIRLPHVLYFEAQRPDRFGQGGISIRELFRASLRMRPDRIIVGECRGGEALDMIQAMTSGHSGSLTTLHANSAFDALQRLETMALMSDVAIPQIALRSQIAQAVDIIVQVERLSSTRQRGVVQVAEMLGLDGSGRFLLQDVFEKTSAVYSRSSSEDTTALTRRTANVPRFATEIAMWSARRK